MSRAGASIAAQSFLDFANKTGSPYHTVVVCAELLVKSGFRELKDGAPWKIEKGGKYFVTKGGSDVMAFVVGGKFSASESGLSIVGAHTDSPCLRLRPNSKVSSGGMLQVGMQTYGGGLWHTWFDRGLGVAGKVVYRDASQNGALVEKLVRITKPVMIIPNLAIHLQSADERKAFAVNTESHLQPVLCSKMYDEQEAEQRGPDPKVDVFARHHAAVLGFIAKEVGCGPSDIIDADLCLMDAQPGNLVGLYDEFISSPRIDNLLSTWAAVQGLCDFATSADVSASSDVCVACSFDHEECGSQSNVGAEGGTLPTWLERVMQALDVQAHTCAEVYSRSFLLSADCAHGLHPNYEAKHQGQHRPDFHKGIVIKTNSNQRYATNALTSALFREVCKRADVPVQDFVVRNDTPCGTTIGPIISAKLGIRAVDIGAPQWAMHSCRETCASSDAGHLLKCCKAFFETFREIDNSTAKL